MRILVVNDDGIASEGIKRLAKCAVKFGEVWVVAPASQCSAMSQRITVRGEIEVRKVAYSVPDVKAYSVGGTPADCVKIALNYLMPEKPDIVFSGINEGYNAGMDILYSGTVGAAVEALSNGIPAIAFSSEMNGIYDVVDEYIESVTKELLEQPLPSNALWNVNFPGCSLDEFKGILKDRIPAQHQFYMDNYIKVDKTDDSFILESGGLPVSEAKEGTDIHAVLTRYISIGIIRNGVIEV